jgi:hypothetical protein
MGTIPARAGSGAGSGSSACAVLCIKRLRHVDPETSGNGGQLLICRGMILDHAIGKALDVVVGVVGFLTMSAFAQNPLATTPVRVAGTIEKLDGDNLTVKTKDDQAVTVTLNADAAIFGVEKRTLADI